MTPDICHRVKYARSAHASAHEVVCAIYERVENS